MASRIPLGETVATVALALIASLTTTAPATASLAEGVRSATPAVAPASTSLTAARAVAATAVGYARSGQFSRLAGLESHIGPGPRLAATLPPYTRGMFRPRLRPPNCRVTAPGVAFCYIHIPSDVGVALILVAVKGNWKVRGIVHFGAGGQTKDPDCRARVKRATYSWGFWTTRSSSLFRVPAGRYLPVARNYDDGRCVVANSFVLVRLPGMDGYVPRSDVTFV
jgi:hypothetical protein